MVKRPDPCGGGEIQCVAAEATYCGMFMSQHNISTIAGELFVADESVLAH